MEVYREDRSWDETQPTTTAAILRAVTQAWPAPIERLCHSIPARRASSMRYTALGAWGSRILASSVVELLPNDNRSYSGFD